MESIIEESCSQFSQGNDEKDMAILVESLRSYETLEPQTRREAFGIIRSLLSQNEMTQNYFRELQGVELMIKIYEHFSKLKDIEVTSNALYTLSVATEQNSVTREELMTPEVFAMVKGAVKLALVPSAFLLLCLTSNNVPGQDLSRTSHCINKLCYELKTKLAVQDETKETVVACDALCTTLCAMISNPVNSSNQDICCRLLLPTLVRNLYLDINTQILQSVINLIGCCIIDNYDGQKCLCVVGGIRALAALLSKSLPEHHADSLPDKKFMMCLVNTLSCSYTNSSANKVQALELDVIEGLLRCLKLFNDLDKDTEVQVTCVSALLNLLDGDDNVIEAGKQKFQDGGGIPELIELLTTKNEKLKKLVTILLQKTFDKEAVSPNGSRSTTITTDETSCDSPVNGHVEMPLIETNHNSEDDIPSTTPIDMTASSKHGQCQCKSIPYVDSHNVLQVLNSNMVCSYHNSLGQAISRYLAKKRAELEDDGGSDIDY